MKVFAETTNKGVCRNGWLDGDGWCKYNVTLFEISKKKFFVVFGFFTPLKVLLMYGFKYTDTPNESLLVSFKGI